MSGVPVLGRARQPAARQGADAAPGHHHVAVAVGVDDAPLVGLRRDELGGVVVEVGHLLDQPPHVFVAEAVVVVAVAHPVVAGGVERVPPGVFEQAVLVVVRGVLGVAVELAAEQPQRLAAVPRPGRRGSARCRRPRSGGPSRASAAGGRRRRRRGRARRRASPPSRAARRTGRPGRGSGSFGPVVAAVDGQDAPARRPPAPGGCRSGWSRRPGCRSGDQALAVVARGRADPDLARRPGERVVPDKQPERRRRRRRPAGARSCSGRRAPRAPSSSAPAGCISLPPSRHFTLTVRLT